MNALILLCWTRFILRYTCEMPAEGQVLMTPPQWAPYSRTCRFGVLWKPRGPSLMVLGASAPPPAQLCCLQQHRVQTLFLLFPFFHRIYV